MKNFLYNIVAFFSVSSIALTLNADLATKKAQLAAESMKAEMARKSLSEFEEAFLKEIEKTIVHELRFIMERCRNSTDQDECKNRLEAFRNHTKALMEQVTVIAPEEGKKAALAQVKIDALTRDIESTELPERLRRPFGYFNS